MSTSSQGKLVGSRGAMFRKTSTSKPDDFSDRSGKDVGAERNYAHEKAAVAKAEASKAKKEQDIINRTKAAAQRAKETLKMAKEEMNEAKGKWIPDRPMKVHVANMEKRDTADLKGMHDRWSGDHRDKKSDPSTSERLLAVHHVLKKRGESVSDLPQHRNLGRMSYVNEESSGTEARMKIRNVARPDDAEPTSEKSKLSKTGEIKTKSVDEDIAASISRKYGLSGGLLEAAKGVMQGKTQVDLDPKTNDKLDDENGDDDDDVKKESKHTTPKSAKDKKLAALAHPKDKITHKDVLVGRGVLKKEETEIEEASPMIKPPAGKYDSLDDAKAAAKKARDSGKQVKIMKHSFTHPRTGEQTHHYSVKEETEIEEAIKPYVSYSGPRPGKSPSATVMAAGEKPHKTFSKDEHGADYKQKAMDYFKKNMKKLHSEEVESDVDSLTEEQLEEVLKKSDSAGKWVSDFVHSKNPKFEGKSKKERMKQALGAYYAKQRNEEAELTAEELERIQAIASQLDEAKPTIVSAPIRGANQDQSGFGVKKNTADYTISDEKKVRKEEVELEEGRGRPKKSGDEAEGDDTHKHPIQQLTKIAHAIEGSEPHFEHKDGAKTKVGKHLAKHVMAVYGSMRTSQEKDDFANKLHASKDSMKSAVSKLF